MREAGFRDVFVVPVSHPFSFPSAESALAGFTLGAPPMRALLESSSPDQVTDFRSELLAALRAEFGEGPVAVHSEANLGIGVK